MPIDYNKYPPNWKTEIRPAILKREGNCCQTCGVGNKRLITRFQIGRLNLFRMSGRLYNADTGKAYGRASIKLNKFINTHKEIKVILTVAHLDHDEHNWKVKYNRLAALCQRCHILYDVEEKKRRRKVKTSKTR